jgi:hypothetical protein
MQVRLSRIKPDTKSKDPSDKMFFGSIIGIVMLGLAANIYQSYTSEAPSLTTFVDLLTVRKTQFCDTTGTVIDGGNGFLPLNCLDYNGYRIVEGSTTYIFEIANKNPVTSGDNRMIPVAELNTDAMKKLFNLRRVDFTYSKLDYPWP